MSEYTDVLVTVKTYPVLSEKYYETVCTAGITKDGKWVRVYPIPFRTQDEIAKYKKWEWVSLRLKRNPNDDRPESYKLVDPKDLKRRGEAVSTDNQWRERRQLILKNASVYSNLDHIISQAKANRLTLCTFKPTKLIDFKCVEEKERTWDPALLDRIKAKVAQPDLFEDNQWRDTFQIVKKVPYKFKYEFEDDEGRRSTLSIIDWEIGALYWNCLRSAKTKFSSSKDAEAHACQKVKEKYWDDFQKKDIHFFLGTMFQWQKKNAPNPWTIIGVFYPPKNPQLSLLDS